VAATTALVLIGKPVAAYLAVRLLRRPSKMGLTVAAALAQVGEFSFILAGLGRELGVLPEPAMQAVVASSIVSITLNPLLVRGAPLAERWLASHARRGGEAGPAVAPVEQTDGHRVIVVGYGPVGRVLTVLLRENHVEPTIVELNHETVVGLGRAGIRAIYGDASQSEILERAGARDAMSLVLAASGTPAADIVQVAKMLNPQLMIVARSTYIGEAADVRRAGANVVVSAEAEVALAMAEQLLARLGATSEQLDRARDRVRHELAHPAEGFFH
jgi:CPA2 family monovalent cation:H+ antiporter-2